MLKFEAVKWIWNAAMAPLSPKNLRLSAILIAIYQVLIAHVMLFIVLLGLAHAEQMKTMLAIDIEDQKEYGFYDLTPYSNQVRLTAASHLVSVTEVMLYVATGIASVYLLSCLGLFVGVFKNRSELILPWLLVNFIGIILTLAIMVWSQNEKIGVLIGGKTEYWMLCSGIILFDIIIWYIVHSFYLSLRQISKLTEIATVAIPCPPPGAIPFHYRRENMYLGSNGYKHILGDAAEPNY